MTAAHKTLPMPSMVKVTRTDNGKSVMVRINDRGPFAHGRIIDLSRAAAEALGVDKMGVAEVRVQYLKDETEQYIASLGQKPPAEWQSALATAAPVVTVAPAPQPILSAPAPVMIATAPVPQPVISATPLPAMPQPVYAEGEGLKPLPFGLRQAPEPVVQPETGYQTGSFAVLDDAPQDPADAQAAGNHYYIQAGSFSLRDNAMRFAGKLEELGPTEVVPVPISDGTLWRVRVGPVFNRGIATEIQTQLTTHGVTDATIIYQP
jgi:rare lipoprotein A